MVKLDILADPICPWCYIGKVQLDTALGAHPNHPFTIEWHPFQLNPDMPKGGMDRAAYLEAKFGGKQAAAGVYAEIDAHARHAGLEIDWAQIRRTPNTLDAHRLIHWAGIEQRQHETVSALYDAYFQKGEDIGEAEVLAEVAGRAGIDAAAVARLLETDADAEEIRTRDAHARARGVTGVPTFIVAGTHVLPGAQPTALWQQVIAEIEEMRDRPPQGHA